jgi:hypothetical protein
MRYGSEADGSDREDPGCHQWLWVIVIPQTIDAVRALTARARSGAESVSKTNATLGMGGSLI